MVANIIFFNNCQEVLYALVSKSKLLKTLLKKHEACPLMFSKNPKIKFLRELGHGVQGSVFEISIKGMTKKYAVKRADFKEVTDKECRLIKKKKSHKYYCDSEQLIEYIVGTLLSPRYTLFANFMDVFSLYLCTDPKSDPDPISHKHIPETFMFTEFLQGVTLSKIEDVSSIDSCVMQVLASIIYCQQPRLKIQHNDLDAKNIMCVDMTTTIDHFESPIPHDTKFFAYRSKDKYFIFPAGKYVAKIIDFGSASKFSYPKVINTQVKVRGRPAPWNPLFDPLFFMYDVYKKFHTPLIIDLLTKGLNTSNIDSEFHKLIETLHQNKTEVNFTAENMFYSKVTESKELPKNAVLLGEIP